MFGNSFATTRRFCLGLGIFFFFSRAPPSEVRAGASRCAVVLTSDSAAAGVQSHRLGLDTDLNLCAAAGLLRFQL